MDLQEVLVSKGTSEEEVLTSHSSMQRTFSSSSLVGETLSLHFLTMMMTSLLGIGLLSNKWEVVDQRTSNSSANNSNRMISSMMALGVTLEEWVEACSEAALEVVLEV